MPAFKEALQEQWDIYVTKVKGKNVKYNNFYETTKEAEIRLKSTVIWYDGPGEQGPYFVLAITDHMGDSKFRIYMKQIGQKYCPDPSIIPPNEQYGSSGSPELGKHMDKFMRDHPSYKIVRKELGSPHFNSFRPFPLGMMNRTAKSKDGKNIGAETIYLERQPNRLTQQGLIRSMIYISPVTAAMKQAPINASYGFDMWSPDFKDCIMGEYPDADTCLSKLRDPRIANEAAAFSRYFAFVRGPCDMLFLSYKGEVVGILSNNNLSSIAVSRDHKYTREAIAELQIFNAINNR